MRPRATSTDEFGNPTATVVRWRVTPAALGSVRIDDRGRAIFTAGRLLGAGTVTARSGTVSSTSRITVRAATLHIGPVAFQAGKRSLRIVLSAVDGARRPVSATSVGIVVRLNEARYFTGRARTGAAGKVGFRMPIAPGCFTVTVTRASAPGFAWNGKSPRNRFCRR